MNDFCGIEKGSFSQGIGSRAKIFVASLASSSPHLGFPRFAPWRSLPCLIDMLITNLMWIKAIEKRNGRQYISLKFIKIS